MFVGRSELTSLVEQMVLVKGGPQVPADGERPVLVVEGYGGSGRSEFLANLWSRWAQRTPSARVDPRTVDYADEDSVRPLLLAVMQGLSTDVDGFEVSFPRAVLAHVAMTEPVAHDADQKRAREIMQERLVVYKDRDMLFELFRSLLEAAGTSVTPDLPGADGLVGSVAARLVDRLRRNSRMARFGWDKAASWFGHEDKGHRFNGLDRLVRLSRQAQLKTPDVVAEVDDLLVAALVADLRDCMARATGRPWHALVLLDNADVPTARSFVAALLRARASKENLPQALPPDPLVVVATSGGLLVGDLAGQDIALPSWRRIAIGELTSQDVHDMTRAYEWPPQLGTRRIADVVYRFTGGHAAGTDLVLRTLRDTPALVEDLGNVLRRNDSEDPDALEKSLLVRFAASLEPHGETGDRFSDHLVTLSAARNRAEAAALRPLIDEPAGHTIMTSSTVWSAADAHGRPALPSFVRYLGLRELVRRKDGTPRWEDVFTLLRNHAEEHSDRAGRLHHDVVLGDSVGAAAELSELLHDIDDTEWLSLLDQITTTPDLRSGDRLLQIMRRGNPDAVVHRIVTTLHELSDPRASRRAELCRRYRQLEHDFSQIAGSSEALLQRSQHYRRLADRLC